MLEYRRSEFDDNDDRFRSTAVVSYNEGRDDDNVIPSSSRRLGPEIEMCGEEEDHHVLT